MSRPTASFRRVRNRHEYDALLYLHKYARIELFGYGEAHIAQHRLLASDRMPQLLPSAESSPNIIIMIVFVAIEATRNKNAAIRFVFMRIFSVSSRMCSIQSCTPASLQLQPPFELVCEHVRTCLLEMVETNGRDQPHGKRDLGSCIGTALVFTVDA